jgi:beta-glucosidase-like glycosyl hydrolase
MIFGRLATGTNKCGHGKDLTASSRSEPRTRRKSTLVREIRGGLHMSETDVMSLARAALVVPFPGSTPPRWLLNELDRGLGGVTLFAINGNVPGAERLAGLTAELRKAGDPVITIDEEGGDVTRLAHATGSPYPGNAALGAVDDPELTRRVHRSLGAELAQAGVNLNFAPSVDVNTADDNPVIGTRAFGSDPQLVARHAAAATTGLQEAGVAACAKHFPGHGATRVDSHSRYRSSRPIWNCSTAASLSRSRPPSRRASRR